MSISVFTDKTHSPNEEEIQQVLVECRTWWEQITAFMQQTYQLPGVLQYGGKNYGWNLWYRRSSRSLLSLYPRDHGITAQIVLGKAEVQKALELPLGAHFSAALRETPAFHDGLWLFIPLESQQDVEDVLQLVLVKAKPKRTNPTPA